MENGVWKGDNVLFGTRLVACIVCSLVSSKTIKIYLFTNLGGGQTCLACDWGWSDIGLVMSSSLSFVHFLQPPLPLNLMGQA